MLKILQHDKIWETVCISVPAPNSGDLQYNTIQYKTYNAPYVTKMLFVGAGMTRD